MTLFRNKLLRAGGRVASAVAQLCERTRHVAGMRKRKAMETERIDRLRNPHKYQAR